MSLYQARIVVIIVATIIATRSPSQCVPLQVRRTEGYLFKQGGWVLDLLHLAEYVCARVCVYLHVCCSVTPSQREFHPAAKWATLA